MLVIPEFSSFYGLLPDPEGNPVATALTGDQVPEPYHSLLVHNHHMTVTVENFYKGPVDVQVLESDLTSEEYTRKILLALRSTRKVVQFGMVQIRLNVLPEPVRAEILSQRTPLGRVLIQNDVLTRVLPTQFLKVTPNASMCKWFGLSSPQDCYGRLGVIFANERPALAMLEILVPIEG